MAKRILTTRTGFANAKDGVCIMDGDLAIATMNGSDAKKNAEDIVKKYNSQTELLRVLKEIEKALRNGKTAETDGDVVQAVREREGDYLTMLTDLGEMAADAIKKAK